MDVKNDTFSFYDFFLFSSLLINHPKPTMKTLWQLYVKKEFVYYVKNISFYE
jgi:hypothetical protein